MSFLNATLVVQAGNFFVAFILIKYLFFKPVLAQIKAEDLFQETLINSVQESQGAIAQKEQELRNQLTALKIYFAQHTPALKSGPFFAEKKTAITLPHFDREITDKNVNQLTDLLVKEVNHVK